MDSHRQAWLARCMYHLWLDLSRNTHRLSLVTSGYHSLGSVNQCIYGHALLLQVPGQSVFAFIRPGRVLCVSKVATLYPKFRTSSHDDIP